METCVVVQKDDSVKGTKFQGRCKKCHNARGRINTLVQKAQGSPDEWKDFTCDERADFVKKGEYLCGRDLHKQMVESIQWVKTRKDYEIR